MIITLCFYRRHVEKRFEEGYIDWEEIDKLTCCDIFKDLVTDYKFWRFLLFSFVIVGPKIVFALLIFMLPRIITQDYGDDAPFGIYISIAPILIILFLYLVAPLQNNYDSYDLILIGCFIATLGPIPMFFGINMLDFIIFVIIISFAEALYSPMLNVFMFGFAKPGREGTFLTLAAAPIYFTMAVTGILGGYLLENYYPPEEDENRHKQPWVIWLIIISLSGASTIVLFFARDYFDCADEGLEDYTEGSDEYGDSED